jgi:hypothetical protein
MDPRIKVPGGALEKKFQAEMRLASLASNLSEAVIQGNSIRTQLDKLSANPQAKDAVEEFRKKLNALLGTPGGFLAPPSPEPTLSRVNGEAGTLYQQVWQSDAQPTAAQMEAQQSIDRSSSDLLKRWTELKSTDLPALNRRLRESQIPEINLNADANHHAIELDEE